MENIWKNLTAKGLGFFALMFVDRAELVGEEKGTLPALCVETPRTARFLDDREFGAASPQLLGLARLDSDLPISSTATPASLAIEEGLFF